MAGGDSAGGSGRLAELIDEHGELIQADFFQFYGLHLRKLLVDGGGMSPREILSLINSLPPDSRYVAQCRGGLEFWGWTITQYQLAQIVDAVNDNSLVAMKAAGAKRAKPADRYYRPDAKKKKKNNQFRSIAASRIAAQRARKAATNGEGSRRG